MQPPQRRTFIVGIGGPSCTGKSSVAKAAAVRLGGRILSMESYYRDLSQLPFEERAKQNFDSPDAVDSVLMQEHIRDFVDGCEINVPVYDFSAHTRDKSQTVRIPSAPVLIVEGILVLHWPGIRQYFDLSAYFDAPDEVCFHRRKVRDIVERQRSQAFILQQWQETVRPMAERYILPTRQIADVVVDCQKSLDAVEGELIAAIRTRVEQKIDDF